MRSGLSIRFTIWALGIALFLLTSIRPVHAEVISTGVGMVRGGLVTSRQVQIQNMLEVALYDRDSKTKLKKLVLDSKAFANAVKDSLLEMAIALEAQSFNLVQLSSKDIDDAEKHALELLRSNSDWKQLEVLPRELNLAIKDKLQAKKFKQFRAQSSALPITDGEARRYFGENRLKFGDLPYENFKDNIKAFLSRNQVDQRLKDWYDVLLSKYQVKNLIAEM